MRLLESAAGLLTSALPTTPPCPIKVTKGIFLSSPKVCRQQEFLEKQEETKDTNWPKPEDSRRETDAPCTPPCPIPCCREDGEPALNLTGSFTLPLTLPNARGKQKALEQPQQVPGGFPRSWEQTLTNLARRNGQPRSAGMRISLSQARVN